MNRRPLLAGTAALSVLALYATAGTAAAATPAVGTATSTVGVLHVNAGGHDLRAGDIALLSDTTSGVVSSVTVTPVIADGTAYGKQVVTPANSPTGVPSASSPNALLSFASLTSPAVDVTATNTPSANAGTTSLGSLSLLGLSVPLTGTVSAGSSVSSTAGSVGQKTVTVQNLGLPSIADVLAALGLDLSALPVGTVSDLVSQLDLGTAAITAAQGAVDAAQANVNAAAATVASATTDLAAANAALAAVQDPYTAATATMTSLLGLAGYIGTVDSYVALLPAVKSAFEILQPGLVAADPAYVAAKAAFDAAAPALNAAIAAAQVALDAANAALDAVQAILDPLVSTLMGLLTGSLDATPLVSLDSLQVSTKATATTAKTGGQSAQIVGGTLTGLHVLGTDVLDTALGNTTLDLGALTGTVSTTVNTAISTLTGTLGSVLSSVPGFPTLEVPAPVVGLLTKATSTSISGGFGRASTTVTGLSIALPAITIPTALALPGAASLPALAGVTQVTGLLSTAPVTISLINLSDQAAFRPAVLGGTSGSPGTSGTGALPNTGMPLGLATVAMLLVAGALFLRRRELVLAD